MNKKLYKEKTVYSFEYRGICAQIENWERESKYDSFENHWTYYIYLNLNHFEDLKLAKSLWITARSDNPNSEKSWERRKHCNYSRNLFLTSLKMHCGITWYSKQLDFSDNKQIKIGCDFQHYWDTGQYYSADSIYNEVLETIDDSHSKTSYLIFCHGDGSLVKECDGKYVKSWKDGILIEDEDKRNFHSNKYIEKQLKEIREKIEVKEKPPEK
jgi:hypothetical protein